MDSTPPMSSPARDRDSISGSTADADSKRRSSHASSAACAESRLNTEASRTESLKRDIEHAIGGRPSAHDYIAGTGSIHLVLDHGVQIVDRRPLPYAEGALGEGG